ncbi:hypothetical protein BDY17DRAFT_292465 [Neohortaea acidophila]|uniref:PWI domain-containing protein n=1 Tax=Neohortaea acidophila TaxID=245834 RepID=A0A6A6PXK6_9PEZI|nr:uncharacterized protein BDY17DRAFT_292465 [Neohortaea acidophila]KAF2484840.1 hypothetical protein BDY17DRAFT_292465 [Neohortaea acidophila]
MAYNNYGPPPGAFGQRQPPYNNHGSGAPPGMGPPPGMDAPPGMHAGSPPVMHNAQFQAPPANMPNFDFNAPVIRMGVPDQPQPRAPSGGGGASGRGSNAEPLGGRRDRRGLGAGNDDPRSLDRERAAVRENMMALHPPTREEVARTIFIGGLGPGAPNDDSIETLLRCAGKLRRWTRARDADDNKCKFGFAEYEDVESLEAANEIYVGMEVPVFNKSGAVVKEDDGDVKRMGLLVVVDEQSKNYIDEWKGKRNEDDDARQFRIDGCKEDLRQSLAALANAGAFLANNEAMANGDGDATMGDSTAETNGEGAEVVTIPLTLEDELADIPAEMRATVAAEIKAFRDRSNRRDLERLRREEEMEQAEKRPTIPGRVNRLASPPVSAPSGPASAANGVPVGPRDRAGGVQGAPSGPRGYRGAQLPSDYVNGVSFVGTNGIAVDREDEEAEESDEELERRRKAKKDADAEKQYLDAERRLLNRERTRAAAQEREQVREEAEKREKEREREAIAKRLREWDDEEEARLAREEYYLDRSSWLRKRGAYRDREQREDDRDRAAEEREKAEDRKRAAEARGLADNFLDQTGNELERKAAEQPGAGFGGFKMSLGPAAARNKTAAQPAAPRRALAEVEGLLEDEEDAAAAGMKRPELKPLTDTSTIPQYTSDLSEEERKDLRQQLAAEIPTSTSALFEFPVKFNFLTPAIITEQIRPFVEKKVVDYLGVQEDLLVDAVMDGLSEKKQARAIVAELEDALEDEAEALVKKVWRMVVFCTECESRGLV